MHLNPTSENSLRRVFNESFGARDVAEPLVSFDSSTPAAQVLSFMEQRDFDVVGIRTNGVVTHFIEREEAIDEDGAWKLHAIVETYITEGPTKLTEVVLGLRDNKRLFVTAFGSIAGIITRVDLEKPPMRMWLFGMITLIEMRFRFMIGQFATTKPWQSFLSEGRLEKARAILAERERRNQNLDLLDCLQFSDLGQILGRNQELRSLTRLESRRQVDSIVKGLERLRNNLAHSQDMIASDWEVIVQLAENLDDILLGPPGLRNNWNSIDTAHTRNASHDDL